VPNATTSPPIRIFTIYFTAPYLRIPSLETIYAAALLFLSSQKLAAKGSVAKTGNIYLLHIPPKAELLVK
jgi:hypothetical protein